MVIYSFMLRFWFLHWFSFDFLSCCCVESLVLRFYLFYFLFFSRPYIAWGCYCIYSYGLGILIIFNFLEIIFIIVDLCITEKWLCEIKFGEYERLIDKIGVNFEFEIIKNLFFWWFRLEAGEYYFMNLIIDSHD